MDTKVETKILFAQFLLLSKKIRLITPLDKRLGREASVDKRGAHMPCEKYF